MDAYAAIRDTLSAIGVIGASMVALALLEVAVPLHRRGAWGRVHLGPNLALTTITFATSALLNVALLAMIVWLERHDIGLARWLALPPVAAGAVAVAALDLAFYAAHVSWHKVPSLWRVHAVHHSDPTVDVTTTIRQHPVEGLLRYAALGGTALLIGPSPGAFAVYRVASAVNGLFEHANVWAPDWMNDLLSRITTWPHMHKIHHSRRPDETDSNYGNLFSIWDRLFGTFTPSSHAAAISYGLSGWDQPALQTTWALLAAPFRRVTPAATTP